MTTRFAITRTIIIKCKSKKIIRPKRCVLVRVHLDGRPSLWYKKQLLDYEEVDQPIKKPRVKTGDDSQRRSFIARKNKGHTPGSQFNPNWLTRHNRNKEDYGLNNPRA